MSETLNKVVDVDIDPNGVFKYILIHVKDNGMEKKIVRGYQRCDYHADIFDETEAVLKKISSSLKAKCLGGGRIKHDAADKKLHVYGYSQGYGKADHDISVSILKTKYSDYDITWSDEGY
ncbi:14 kDa phosphohistidine phosphatase [Copidosoma floridanum]|uniref:14 kDa phosphohistidine phosphatase n=1 Tax=Copidosoma floridanum TaxID=29053 RepID=UPI0006C96D0F|nr:14 kDa phosphohistidine phosphatase [Copidosoma floridanum]